MRQRLTTLAQDLFSRLSCLACSLYTFLAAALRDFHRFLNSVDTYTRICDGVMNLCERKCRHVPWFEACQMRAYQLCAHSVSQRTERGPCTLYPPRCMSTRGALAPKAHARHSPSETTVWRCDRVRAFALSVAPMSRTPHRRGAVARGSVVHQFEICVSKWSVRSPARIRPSRTMICVSVVGYGGGYRWY